MDAWRAQLHLRLERDLRELGSQPPNGSISGLERHLPAASIPRTPPEPKLAAAPGRGEPWLADVVSLLVAHDLPRELLAVAAVESGFNPSALSPAGARGLWQLMPATARRYGLVVEASRDERLDPLKSTAAAARYLKDLYGRFQNWPLALAAYNAGEQRVERSLERRGGDFWTLNRLAALPEETRRYVPAVLAKFQTLIHSGRPPATASPKRYDPPQGRVVYASATTVSGFESK
jgi:membrane-bound lytic murein transglycosylase D